MGRVGGWIRWGEGEWIRWGEGWWIRWGEGVDKTGRGGRGGVGWIRGGGNKMERGGDKMETQNGMDKMGNGG